MSCVVCAGLNLGVTFTVQGLIVASSIAISDLVHRRTEHLELGLGAFVHFWVAFVVFIGLHVLFYVFFWFGRGNLTDRKHIKPPSVDDFFGCPPNATCDNCFESWWVSFDPKTYQPVNREDPVEEVIFFE